MAKKQDKIVYIVSLGCAKNLVDSEVMCGSLVTHGFYIAESPDVANIYLVNTCGFIRDAKKESNDFIEEAVAWKSQARGRIIVVTGCLAQRSPEVIQQAYPQVDLIAGLDDVPRLPELIDLYLDKSMKHEVSQQRPTYLYTDETPRVSLTPEAYAYVKVAEGCDHRCAYCAIPLIRGNQRSRSPESVERECIQLLQNGAYELNFIAQDTSRYGTDLSPQENLEKLLRRCDRLDGDFWLRVLYTHPLHLTDGLLDVLGNSRHVVPYLDIPLQHISTNVLQGMRRGMDGDKTRELLARIRRDYPQLSIRTTFLVGFPGETEENFQELLGFVKEFRFDRLGVFAFSPEEGTPAATMTEGIVPPDVAEQRKKNIMELQAGISLEKNKAMIGKTIRVLLETQLKSRQWEGRTAADAPDVDQFVTIATKRKYTAPCFVEAVVEAADEYSLSASEI
ncbi:MAG: 30S ribosomal protein S12 methylthiotransferase RimO [Victivallales bacterium]|nr:30S ribosomal protein S12 methylthiotransferase RimO [Victivallales bacterium]